MARPFMRWLGDCYRPAQDGTAEPTETGTNAVQNNNEVYRSEGRDENDRPREAKSTSEACAKQVTLIADFGCQNNLQLSWGDAGHEDMGDSEQREIRAE